MALLLCRVKRAEKPYYIETMEQEVFSLEEIMYLLYNAKFADGADFMNEKFIEWVRDELDEAEIAEEMSAVYASSNASLKKFFLPIEQNNSYLTSAELSILNVKLEKFDHMTELESGKMSADNFLNRGKVTKAIHAYIKLLSNSRLTADQAHVAGDVWNNLGLAYVKLGDYREAFGAFIRAYSLNHRAESFTQAIACGALSDDSEIKDKLDKRFASARESIEKETASIKKLYEESRVRVSHELRNNTVPDQWAREYVLMCED